MPTRPLLQVAMAIACCLCCWLLVVCTISVRPRRAVVVCLCLCLCTQHTGCCGSRAGYLSKLPLSVCLCADTVHLLYNCCTDRTASPGPRMVALRAAACDGLVRVCACRVVVVPYAAGVCRQAGPEANAMQCFLPPPLVVFGVWGRRGLRAERGKGGNRGALGLPRLGMQVPSKAPARPPSLVPTTQTPPVPPRPR